MILGIEPQNPQNPIAKEVAGMIDPREYKALAVAVIADAVEDMQKGCPDAGRFIMSSDLALWCDILELDADVVRARAKERNFGQKKGGYPTKKQN